MLLSHDLNQYTMIALQKEFAHTFYPPQKKNNTDAYKKTVSAVREQKLPVGTDPSEVLARLDTVLTELVKFPQNETIQPGFLELYEGLVVDYYA